MNTHIARCWADILLKIQDQEHLTKEEVEFAWSFLWEEWKQIDAAKLKLKFLPQKLKLFLAMRKVDPMVLLTAPTFLVSIFSKGLIGEEIKGFMQSFYNNKWFDSFYRSGVELPGLVYTNGFGGDRVKTVNVSTPAMIIAAAGGAKILKMGSHSYFGASGAQNFTDAVGLKALTTPGEVQTLLGKVNSAFIDGAAAADPSTQGIAYFLAHVPEGRELMKAMFYPFRYMVLCFNFFKARIHQRGISTLKTELAADLLLAALEHIELGHIAAGMDREGNIIDEISNVGKTKITVIEGHRRTETFFTTPADWGVKERKPTEICGGLPGENLKIILEIFMGKREDAYCDLLAVNASHLLFLSGVVKNFKAGTFLAREMIAEGKALEELKKSVACSGGNPEKLAARLKEIK